MFLNHSNLDIFASNYYCSSSYKFIHAILEFLFIHFGQTDGTQKTVYYKYYMYQFQVNANGKHYSYALKRWVLKFKALSIGRLYSSGVVHLHRFLASLEYYFPIMANTSRYTGFSRCHDVTERVKNLKIGIMCLMSLFV